MCDYTKKTEDFQEAEIIAFLEDLVSNVSIGVQRTYKYDKLKDCKDYITYAYFLKTNRKFDEDFPNVQEFVEEYCPDQEMLVWKKFCAFNNKKTDFTEEDILAYLNMYYKKFETETIVSMVDKTYSHMLVLSKCFYEKAENNICEGFLNVPQNKEEIDAYFNNPDLFEDLKSLRIQGIYEFQNKDHDYSDLEKKIWREFCTFVHRKNNFYKENVRDYFKQLSIMPSPTNPAERISTSTLQSYTTCLANVFLGETGQDIWKRNWELPKSLRQLEESYYPDRIKQKEAEKRIKGLPVKETKKKQLKPLKSVTKHAVGGIPAFPRPVKKSNATTVRILKGLKSRAKPEITKLVSAPVSKDHRIWNPKIVLKKVDHNQKLSI